MSRLQTILLLSLPFSAVAQAPMHFTLSETVPSTLSTRDGHAISTRQTFSLVTVGVRDSSGVSLWEMRVDSTSSVIIPRDSLEARQLNMQVGPVGLRQPWSYRANVRNGQVLATMTDGKPTDFPLSDRHPQWSLLVQLPALASLPKAGLPGQVGESRIDTTARHTPLADGGADDTTIVQWTRTAASLVNGAVTHHVNISGKWISATDGVGSVQIVLDADDCVLEVRSKLEEKHGFGPKAAMMLRPDPVVTTMTLMRVP